MWVEQRKLWVENRKCSNKRIGKTSGQEQESIFLMSCAETEKGNRNVSIIIDALGLYNPEKTRGTASIQSLMYGDSTRKI